MNHPTKDALYQHYKGKMYRVIDVVRHSESLDEHVLYECLYENPLGKLWVRPLKMFMETVTIEGVTRPRFKFVEN